MGYIRWYMREQNRPQLSSPTSSYQNFKYIYTLVLEVN